MWQIVYIATTKTEAQKIEKNLSKKGFLVKIDPMESDGFQIKVPESEAEEVYEHLN